MDNSGINAHNVVTMTDFQSDTGFSALAQVEAYWEALRGDRLMPKRSEIDPRGIQNVLEFAFIVERIAPGVARLRVAGSHLSDLMGMEVRGMPLTAFFAPGSRRQISDALEEVFETPALCQLRLTTEHSAEGGQREARMLLLPLKSDLGDVSRILGCVVMNGEMSHAPSRFEVARATVQPLQPGKPISRPDAPPYSVPPAVAPFVSATVPGFAEPETGFADKGTTASNAKRPPYLRLIKSDD